MVRSIGQGNSCVEKTAEVSPGARLGNNDAQLMCAGQPFGGCESVAVLKPDAQRAPPLGWRELLHLVHHLVGHGVTDDVQHQLILTGQREL